MVETRRKNQGLRLIIECHRRLFQESNLSQQCLRVEGEGGAPSLEGLFGILEARQGGLGVMITILSLSASDGGADMVTLSSYHREHRDFIIAVIRQCTEEGIGYR